MTMSWTMTRRGALGAMLAAGGWPAWGAAAQGFEFPSIDGGVLTLEAWRGRPVLVVNTASRCGFTAQYDGLQALYDRYRKAGLIVLAVPSDSFAQELESEAEVKAFCELNFNLDLPMTEITPVKGRDAHPFYRWLAEDHGFVPRWNFNKVLLGADGSVRGTWGATAEPMGQGIRRAVEGALGS